MKLGYKSISDFITVKKVFSAGKKADLSLSINAIVVLILAITMLGLGLGFMKKMFSKTTSQFEDVSDTMKNQVVEDIMSTNDRIGFNKYEIETKKSSTRDLFYGIRNDLGTDTDFTVAATCLKGLDGSSDPTDLSISTFTEVTGLKSGDVKVLKLIITASSNAKLTTYPCQIAVTTGGAEYRTKEFYVKVV